MRVREVLSELHVCACDITCVHGTDGLHLSLFGHGHVQPDIYMHVGHLQHASEQCVRVLIPKPTNHPLQELVHIIFIAGAFTELDAAEILLLYEAD